MNERSSLQDFYADPTVRYLPELLEAIHHGRLLFPRFQRPLVWDKEMRLQLLDSVVKGMPIGTILEWRTTHQGVSLKEELGPFLLPQVDESQPIRVYLLDGQQRLSSLYFALYDVPSDDSLGEEKGENPESYRVYYDLDEELFLTKEDIRKERPNYLPLPVILEGKRLTKFQRDLASELGKKKTQQSKIDSLVERSDEIADAIRRYKIPIVPIVSNDLARVTSTFKRINRQVVVMNEVDMVQALAFGDGIDLHERFEQLKEGDLLTDVGWGELDDTVLLRVIKVALGRGVFETAPDDDAHEIAKHPNVFSECESDLVRVAKFLKDYCGIAAPSLVPYPLQIVLLAAAFRENDKILEEDKKRLADWLWFTTYTAVFASQISESRIRKFLTEVRGIAQSEQLRDPVVKKLTRRPLPRFDFRNARSKALALLLAQRKPQDPNTNKPFDATELLALSGTKVMAKLVPSPAGSVSPTGARVLCPPEEIRQLKTIVTAAGIDSGLYQQNSMLLESHVIDQENAALLSNNRFEEFIHQREDQLNELEEKRFAAIESRLYPPKTRRMRWDRKLSDS